MKKNSVLLIVVILLFITIPLGLIGCETADERFEKRIFETEYFRCVENEETDTVTILEFTQKGLKQKAVIIPETINGKKVKSIGKANGSFTQNAYSLYCEDKKIYLPEISTYNSFLGYNAEFILYGSNNYLIFDYQILSQNVLYVFRKEKEKTRFNIKETNIAFYTGAEGKEDIPYWVDAYSEENLYLLPPEPKMKGYVFGGWYREPECVNEWNGEYVFPEGQEELNLYAKWTKAA